MNNPKANKRVSISNDSFLGFDNNALQVKHDDVSFRYMIDERESSALESVFNHLFELLADTDGKPRLDV